MPHIVELRGRSRGGRRAHRGPRRVPEEVYSLGKFVVSGRKVPRTGGVILASCSDREELKRILEEDPFFRAKVAEYDVVEFVPTMTAPGFGKLQGG